MVERRCEAARLGLSGWLEDDEGRPPPCSQIGVVPALSSVGSPGVTVYRRRVVMTCP